MRTRHRIPSIFNLSMVDVLCCALGCMILLWLLNLREAKQKAAQAGQSGEQVVALQAQLADVNGKYKATQAQLDDSEQQASSLRGQLAAAEDETRGTAARFKLAQADRDAARLQIGRLESDLGALRADKKTAEEGLARREKELAALEKSLAALKADKAGTDEALARRLKETNDLEKSLAGLRADKSAAEGLLAKRTKDLADREKKGVAAAERIAMLEGQVRDRGTDAVSATRRADDLAARLKESETKAKDYRDKLAAEEALAKGLEKEINKRVRDLDDAEKGLAARTQDLERTRKELETARRSVATLEDEKKGLAAAAEREHLAADNRFAGIQLTGRRVVFLIDMSGSMEYVDEKTLAPEKWSGVRETMGKIMRSLPELEKYQIICFSDKVTFLLGNDGAWLDFDRRSAARATEALRVVKPKGGTNMYAAFDSAFRFRAEGLDTIYFLSDGLPNMGEGLSEEQAKGLKETDQAEILGKYVRRKLQSDWNRTIRGEGRVRVNAVGFFYESPDVGAFLWALTRENEGGFVGMSKP